MSAPFQRKAPGKLARGKSREAEIVFEGADAELRVGCDAPGSLRLRMLPRGGTASRSFAVLDAPPRSVELSGRRLPQRAEADPLELEVAADASLRLREEDGIELTVPAQGWRVGAEGGGELWIRLEDEDRLYGLGEKAAGLERRGRVWKQWNRDAFRYRRGEDPLYKSIPFLVLLREGRALGLFLDAPGASLFDCGVTHREFLVLSCEHGPLEVQLIAGPRPLDVVRNYLRLTGRPFLPPRWALGYQQCRYSYYPDSRVLELAEEFRERRIPCDVVYLDIHHLEGYRSFRWDPKRFPDPRGLIERLHELGVRVIAIVDPGLKIEEGYAPYDQGLAADLFVRGPEGEVHRGLVWPGSCAFPDYLRTETRRWWGELYAPLLESGLDGFWNDMNEPAQLDDPEKSFPAGVMHEDDDGAAVPHEEIHNVYGALMVRASREGVAALRPKKRPFLLTRAAYAGSQRDAAAWSGDNLSRWDDLELSLPMALSMALAGFPLYGPDIGGFVGTPDPELVTRWLQLGSVLGLMRMHADVASPDQEPWAFGPEFEALNRASILRRQRLLPTLYTLVHRAAEDGTPLLAPPVFHWPECPWLAEEEDSFLVGDHLLVAPVLQPGARERALWLPPGRWFPWEGEAMLPGGRRIAFRAPLDTLPAFVRGGGVLALQEGVPQLDAEAPGLLLRVYAAGDGDFELIDDAGDGPPELPRWRMLVESRDRGLAHEVELLVRENDADSVRALPERWGHLAFELAGRESAPTRVLFDGEALPPEAMSHDAASGIVRCQLAGRELPKRIRWEYEDEARPLPSAAPLVELPHHAETRIDVGEPWEEQWEEGWRLHPMKAEWTLRWEPERLRLGCRLLDPPAGVPCRNTLGEGLRLSLAPTDATRLAEIRRFSTPLDRRTIAPGEVLELELEIAPRDLGLKRFFGGDSWLCSLEAFVARDGLERARLVWGGLSDWSLPQGRLRLGDR